MSSSRTASPRSPTDGRAERGLVRRRTMGAGEAGSMGAQPKAGLMAVLRLFASAREAAGLSVDRIDGATVGDVLDEARRRYGEQFAAVLTHSRVWVNGQPADVRATLREGDVVAVLPPVSGGSDAAIAELYADSATKSAKAGPREPLEELLPFT